jgi:hypothetical protein
MARIRTIKPEFWEDDVIGCLSREERLLFIATWTVADDEGLLRWSAPYLKSSAFMYDNDIDLPEVERMMAKLEQFSLIFSYRAGKAQQSFGYIVNFQKHQKINRPSPSRILPPPVGDVRVREMYSQRDGGKCHLCGGPIEDAHDAPDEFRPSLDHLTPRSKGGSDYPSNIRLAHETCNRGRRDRSIEEYRELLAKGKTVAQARYPDRFTESLTEKSVSHQAALSEASGAELGTRIRDQEGSSSEANASAAPAAVVSVVRSVEAEVYRVGREVLGKSAGGMITDLRKAQHFDDRAALDLIEQARAKDDPREWLGAVLRGDATAATPDHILFPPEAYRNVL